MLQNKHNSCPNAKNWENFRKQRNLVEKLKRKSTNKYFIDRCTGGCKAKNFWSTVKSFLTNKGCKTQKDTILCENENLVTDQKEVCGIFNDFFVNVAQNIGKYSIPVDESHPSIEKNKSNNISDNTYTFEPIDTDFTSKQINKLNIKKATGNDGISSKLVQLAKPSFLKPVTDLINMSISTSVFPDKLKQAQVTPIHEKNTTLDKGNYRPVSILPILSKLYERTMNTQIVNYFNDHFNSSLSAFRSGYGCQTALLRIVEDWKIALDNN